MAYVDKQISCQDCGKAFTFTASEQELFAQKGYQNDPKRCPDCRSARKDTRMATSPAGATSSTGPRQFFTAVCSSCGGEARVPFQPRNDKPVYCSTCFSKIKPAKTTAAR